jgi:hypothetical protein
MSKSHMEKYMILSGVFKWFNSALSDSRERKSQKKKVEFNCIDNER